MAAYRKVTVILYEKDGDIRETLDSKITRNKLRDEGCTFKRALKIVYFDKSKPPSYTNLPSISEEEDKYKRKK